MKTKIILCSLLLTSNLTYAWVGSVVSQYYDKDIQTTINEYTASKAQEASGYDSQCDEMRQIRKFAINRVTGYGQKNEPDWQNIDTEKCRK